MQAARVEASIGFYPHRKGPCLPRGTDTPSVPAHTREELTQEVLSTFSPDDGKEFRRWEEDKGDRSQVTAAMFLSFHFIPELKGSLASRQSYPPSGRAGGGARAQGSQCGHVPGACPLGSQLGSVGQTKLQLQQGGYRLHRNSQTEPGTRGRGQQGTVTLLAR